MSPMTVAPPEILPPSRCDQQDLAVARVDGVELAVVGAEEDRRLAARHLRDRGRGVDVGARCPWSTRACRWPRRTSTCGRRCCRCRRGRRPPRAWSRTCPELQPELRALGAGRPDLAAVGLADRVDAALVVAEEELAVGQREPALDRARRLELPAHGAVAGAQRCRPCRSRSRSRSGRCRTAARTPSATAGAASRGSCRSWRPARRPRPACACRARAASRRSARCRRTARRRRARRACSSTRACRCACRSRAARRCS